MNSGRNRDEMEIKFTGYHDGTWERLAQGGSYVKALLIHDSGLSTSRSAQQTIFTHLVLNHTNPLQPGQNPPICSVSHPCSRRDSSMSIHGRRHYVSMPASLGPSARKQWDDSLKHGDENIRPRVILLAVFSTSRAVIFPAGAPGRQLGNPHHFLCANAQRRLCVNSIS